MSNSDRVFTPAARAAQAERGSARAYDRRFAEGFPDRVKPERAILFTLEAWDVNCSSHILARYTEAEIGEAFSVFRQKLAALEAENKMLRDRLDTATPKAAQTEPT